MQTGSKYVTCPGDMHEPCPVENTSAVRGFALPCPRLSCTTPSEHLMPMATAAKMHPGFQGQTLHSVHCLDDPFMPTTTLL